MDMELRLLEERLDNWGIVVRDGLRYEHCASVEHRYRPERGEAFEARRVPGPVIDVADGWLIERAWKALRMPHHRWLLKLHFVRKMPRNAVIKWVSKRTGHAIKQWHYKGELIYAMRQLKKVVDTVEVNDENRCLQLDSLLKSKSVLALSGADARPEEKQPAQV